MITYARLLSLISAMSEKDLQKTATVFLSETKEYVAISDVDFTRDDTDVLDEGHPILEVNY